MRKDKFDRLMKSTQQAVEHAQGKRNDLRTTLLPKPPAQMKADDIVKLRKRLECSQAVFANVLNISVKTVQSWEQGAGQPSGAALKLLAIAEKNPKVLFI